MSTNQIDDDFEGDNDDDANDDNEESLENEESDFFEVDRQGSLETVTMSKQKFIRKLKI